MSILKNFLTASTVAVITTFSSQTTIAEVSPTASSTLVRINLTSQTATLYKNNTMVKTFQVMTGSDKNPTPTGTFKINNNRDYTPNGNNIVLTGSYGTARVGIWNPFIRNSIAFHNAPWRKEYEFGNPQRRKKFGSHGCVNMRYNDALYLYNNTKPGTTVIVSK